MIDRYPGEWQVAISVILSPWHWYTGGLVDRWIRADGCQRPCQVPLVPSSGPEDRVPWPWKKTELLKQSSDTVFTEDRQPKHISTHCIRPAYSKMLWNLIWVWWWRKNSPAKATAHVLRAVISSSARSGDVSSGNFSMRLAAMQGSAVPCLCSECGNTTKDQWNVSYQLLLDYVPRHVNKTFTEFPPVVSLPFPSSTRKPCRDVFHRRE